MYAKSAHITEQYYARIIFNNVNRNGQARLFGGGLRGRRRFRARDKSRTQFPRILRRQPSAKSASVFSFCCSVPSLWQIFVLVHWRENRTFIYDHN